MSVVDGPMSKMTVGSPPLSVDFKMRAMALMLGSIMAISIPHCLAMVVITSMSFFGAAHISTVNESLSRLMIWWST